VNRRADEGPAYDVVVFGGGPAGAATALTLCRYSRWAVALIEPGDVDDTSARPRSAPVGQTLSPGIDALLAFLGVSGAFSADSYPRAYGTAAAWGSNVARSRDFIFSPFGGGWHLDRRRFDRMLTAAVATAGGTVFAGVGLTNETMRVDRDTRTWRLTIRSDSNRTDTIRARFVVDATGRRAHLARRLGVARVRVDRLVAVVGTMQSPAAHDGTTFVEACEQGWWYSTPGPDGLTVAFVSDADLVRAAAMSTPAVWQRALASTTHLSERTRGSALSGLLRIHAADSSRLAAVTGDGWVAVGDAGAAHDPLSSSGVPRALASGAAAARAIDAQLRSSRRELDAYAAASTHDFEAYTRMRSAYYGVEQRWPRAPFWARRRAHT